ncbi:MAG: hypothetical protein JO140_02100 [Candidatus Eremiobacteraeota bacterium]|nr:hypothetical protein [Candidatus Eremiobacteraeota bacterium]
MQKPRFFNEIKKRVASVGVATGLAWTPVGGDIMFIETSSMPGTGKLTLTGQLGDVMKESATAAVSFLRSRSGELGLTEEYFAKHDLHIHVPAGAVPKDGPSAGIAIATSIASLLTQKKVNSDLAMTGEITLTGQVLPVGGIKEKVLGAKRAGIRKILLPRRNELDLDDVPKEIRDTMEFVLVDELSEVFLQALGNRIITPVYLGVEPARRANNVVALRPNGVKRMRVNGKRARQISRKRSRVGLAPPEFEQQRGRAGDLVSGVALAYFPSRQAERGFDRRFHTRPLVHFVARGDGVYVGRRRAAVRRADAVLGLGRCVRVARADLSAVAPHPVARAGDGRRLRSLSGIRDRRVLSRRSVGGLPLVSGRDVPGHHRRRRGTLSALCDPDDRAATAADALGDADPVREPA